MNHYYQPENSKSCGQHCVAMIANISPEKSIELFDSDKATRTIQLHNVLKSLGVQTKERLTKLKKDQKPPERCIVKVTYDWRKNTGHWIVFNNGLVLCPSLGVFSYDDYFKNEYSGRPTSYLKIN